MALCLQQWSLEQADNYHNGIMAAIEDLASGDKVWQRSDVRKGYLEIQGWHACSLF